MAKRRCCRLFVGLSLALLLSACASVPEVPVDQDRSAFLARAAQVESVLPWRFAGRLVLETPEESWAGQLSWRAESGGQVIDLSGPAGRGGGRLVLGGGQALLLTRDGERYEASDPDELMLRMTGRGIPVEGLDYWVRGMARPGAPFDLVSGPGGRPSRLIQDGWEIVYGAFENVGGVFMPAGIDLRRSDLSLRLSIQRWQLGVAPAP